MNVSVGMMTGADIRMVNTELNQFFEGGDRGPVRFGVTLTTPLSPAQEEAGAKALEHRPAAELKALVDRLETRRILLLTAERGARKATIAGQVAALLRARGGARRETLVAEPLDRRVRVDFRHLAAKDDELAGRVLIFRDAFARGNPDLLQLFEKTDRIGWEDLGIQLRHRRTCVIFTATPREVERFRARAAHELELFLEPDDEAVRAATLDRRLAALESDPAGGGIAAVLAAERKRLIETIPFAARLDQFVDSFVLLHRAGVGLEDALRRSDDAAEWLLDDLEEDLEAWIFGLTLTLAQCTPDADGVSWILFDALHRRVSAWIRGDRHLFPDRRVLAPRTEAPAPPSLCDEALVQRCRAVVEKDPASLSDRIRFQDVASVGRLWTTLLTRHRRVLTAILPNLRALAEDTERSGDRRLRVLAAQILGRLGEIDPVHVTAPLVDSWAKARAAERQVLLGSLLEGVLAGEARYRTVGLESLRVVARESGTEATDGSRTPLVAVIAACARIGRHDLALAMRELGGIVQRVLVSLMAEQSQLEERLHRMREEVRRNEVAAARHTTVSTVLVAASRREALENLNRAAVDLSRHHKHTYLATRRALVSLCAEVGPAGVFAEMGRWFRTGGWGLGLVTVLLFFSEDGIADHVSTQATGMTRAPILDALLSGDAGTRDTVHLLHAMHESFTSSGLVEIGAHQAFRNALSAALLRWIEAALETPEHEAALHSLLRALRRTDQDLRDLVESLFDDERFFEEPKLRAFAASQMEPGRHAAGVGA